MLSCVTRLAFLDEQNLGCRARFHYNVAPIHRQLMEFEPDVRKPKIVDTYKDARNTSL